MDHSKNHFLHTFYFSSHYTDGQVQCMRDRAVSLTGGVVTIQTVRFSV